MIGSIFNVQNVHLQPPAGLPAHGSKSAIRARFPPPTTSRTTVSAAPLPREKRQESRASGEKLLTSQVPGKAEIFSLRPFSPKLLTAPKEYGTHKKLISQCISSA